MALLTAMKKHAGTLKSELRAIHLALRDPRTPWYVKAVVALVLLYALSPIDLIPDFLPVLGYLDDLILVPLGIALAIRLIPITVLADCRARSRELSAGALPASRWGVLLVIAIWLLLMAGVGWWLYVALT